MMNGSLVWNHQLHFEPDANIDYLDPTNHAPVDLISGYESGGITLGTATVNATVHHDDLLNGRNAPVIGKLSGMYQFPWGINFAANFNGHSSYPYNPFILTGNRTGGQAGVAIFLNPSNALRYPALFQTDIHVDKTLAFGGNRRDRAQLRLVQPDEQQRRAHPGRAAQPVDRRQHHHDAGAAGGALRAEGEFLASRSGWRPASRTAWAPASFFDRRRSTRYNRVRKEGRSHETCRRSSRGQVHLSSPSAAGPFLSFPDTFNVFRRRVDVSLRERFGWNPFFEHQAASLGRGDLRFARIVEEQRGRYASLATPRGGPRSAAASVMRLSTPPIFPLSVIGWALMAASFTSAWNGAARCRVRPRLAPGSTSKSWQRTWT